MARTLEAALGVLHPSEYRRLEAWRGEAVFPVGVEFAVGGEPEREFADREHAAQAGATARASVPRVAGAVNVRHPREIAALRPGRGLPAAVLALLAPRWHPSVRLPSGGFPTLQRHAQEALALLTAPGSTP
jgi:hypothetical protein